MEGCGGSSPGTSLKFVTVQRSRIVMRLSPIAGVALPHRVVS